MHEYIGKTLNKNELFNIFTDKLIAAEPQKDEPYKFIIRYIADTWEDAEAWQREKLQNDFAYHQIFMGKMSRKGSGKQIIENCSRTFEHMVAEWKTVYIDVTNDIYECVLILLPTGKALFVQNLAPVAANRKINTVCMEFDWYIYGTEFTLESENGSYRGEYCYTERMDYHHRYALLELEKNISDKRLAWFPTHFYRHHSLIPYHPDRAEIITQHYQMLKKRGSIG